MIQWLILGGVVWVALAVGVALMFGAVAKDPELYADDEDWTWPPRTDPERHWTGAGDADDFEVPANVMWPHRIDQRRD